MAERARTGSLSALLVLVALAAAGVPSASAATRLSLFALDNTPRQLASGPSGDVWFFSRGNRTMHVTPRGRVRRGPLLQFPPPAKLKLLAGGTGRTLWAAGCGCNSESNSIARVAGGGSVSVFRDATPDHVYIDALAGGRDGDAWFAGSGANGNEPSVIGHVASTGAIRHFSLASALHRATALAAATDGALWFREERLTVPETEPGAPQMAVPREEALVRMTADGQMRDVVTRPPGAFPGTSNLAATAGGGVAIYDDAAGVVRVFTTTAEQGWPVAGARSGAEGLLVPGPRRTIWLLGAVPARAVEIKADGTMRSHRIPGGRRPVVAAGAAFDGKGRLWMQVAPASKPRLGRLTIRR